MRYLKVFLLVLIFLLVMMFFVQNQDSFSDPVVLHFDSLVFQPVQSMPLPLYVIMLLCFTFGALLVLAMLLWDRVCIQGRFVSCKHKVNGLEKKLQAIETERDKVKAELNVMEGKMREELKDAEQRVNAALRAAQTSSQPALTPDALD